jgi:cbb3-type cytochrome oxidase subunit 3
MYKQILQSIDDISVFPIISFVIFFTFFLGLLWWVFKMDKGEADRMAEMPLDDEPVND